MYNYVSQIVDPLYEVGGSVRDHLLGKEPSDYDFCTPKTPDEIEQAVRDFGRRPYLIGKRFGTVGLKVEGRIVEITTFRSEKYPEGSRKPDVEFVQDIAQDLARRDFTINAMASRGGKIIDPFKGKEDLQNGLIRAVGTPSHRFKEDPLRLLRAIRFAAQLGFEVEDLTKRVITKLSYKVLKVSKERWIMEMDKLLIAPHAEEGLRLLEETRLLNFILPELAIQVGYDQDSPYHTHTLWRHTVKVVAAVPPSKKLRWAALLHDIGKPFVAKKNKRGYTNYVHHERVGAEMVERIGRYLRWSKDRIEKVSEIILNHLNEDSALREADNSAKKDGGDV